MHTGCGHDVQNGSGYTTVHIGGAAESMDAARRMNLMDRLSNPEIETIPTGGQGGIMVFAQLIGGGHGALWVGNGTGGTWTLPNGAYNFSALGYDGASGASLAGQAGPYCGLALGDSGRGSAMVLAGTLPDG